MLFTIANLYLRKLVTPFDLFGAPVAQLNINGKSEMKTAVGGVISVGIWAIILAFTYVRAVKMVAREDPFTS